MTVAQKMQSLATQLWNDERGFLISSELILLATVLVIGLLAGLVTLRDQVVQEMADVAIAVSRLDHSYTLAEITTPNGSMAASGFVDESDLGTNDPKDKTPAGAQAPNPIDVLENVVPTGE